MTKVYTPVRARYVTYRNGKAYIVRYGKKANGNWVTKSYKAGEEVERDMWIKDHNANLDKNNPHTLSKFSKKQISEIQHVYAKLDEYGIGLTEAVDGFIERTSPISLRTKLSEALKVFERVQRFEKVKEKTISNARHSVYNRFIRTLKDKPVGLVTKEDVREFLGTGNDNTRANYLRNLKRFFNILKSEGLNSGNPCDQIKIQTTVKRGKGYEPWELYVFLIKCIELKKWKTFAANVFAGFFGLRLEEATGLIWEELPNFEEEDGYIEVSPEVAKTKRRRTLYVSDVGKTWLQMIPANEKRGQLATDYSITQMGRKIRNACKKEYDNFSLGQNQVRQAFAANHFAKYRNIEELRRLMGNSPDVIEDNYNGLVKRDEEEIYWNLYSPKIFVGSLPAAIKTRLWRYSHLNEVYCKDYNVIQNVDRKDETKSQFVAITREKYDEGELRAEASGYTEEEKMKFYRKSARVAFRNRDNKNEQIVKAVTFERAFRIRGQDLQKIQKLKSAKSYLESKLGKNVYVPEGVKFDVEDAMRWLELPIAGPLIPGL